MASKPPAPSDLADKFMLRLPDGMRDRLKTEASANGRSLNAEIVHRLETSLLKDDERDPAINEFVRLLVREIKETRMDEFLDIARRVHRGQEK